MWGRTWKVAAEPDTKDDPPPPHPFSVPYFKANRAHKPRVCVVGEGDTPQEEENSHSRNNSAGEVYTVGSRPS